MIHGCPRCGTLQNAFANYYADHGRYQWAPGWWEIGCPTCLPEPDYYLPIAQFSTVAAAANSDEHMREKVWYTISVQRAFWQLVIGALNSSERVGLLGSPWPRSEYADDEEHPDEVADSELGGFDAIAERIADRESEWVVAPYNRT